MPLPEARAKRQELVPEVGPHPEPVQSFIPAGRASRGGEVVGEEPCGEDFIDGHQK